LAAAGAGAIDAQHLTAQRDITLVAGNLIHQAAPAAPISPLHQLPSPPAAFTGRDDELADLEKQLASDHAAGATISATATRHAGLQGTPGVGKTALAVVLAHRLRDRYPDAQLYLNLHGAGADAQGYGSTAGIKPVTPVEAMQRVIHDFHPEARLPDTLDALAPTYRSVLAGAGRVLLLLDNAADAAQVQPLVPPPNCLLLVTSRAQFSLTGMATRNIDCLKPAKSQELLLTLAPRLKGHEQEAAELCGHLPLALEVFAGAVNDKSLTAVPELLKRLREHKDRLAPVDAAFEVSHELLSGEQRRRWTQLAVFPAGFDLPAAAAVWGARPSPGAVSGVAPDTRPAASPGGPVGGDADRSGRDGRAPEDRAAMQALVNASLVEWNKDNGRFRLHDLVRQFCDGKLTDAERTAARFRHAGHYRDEAAAAHQLYLQGGVKVLRGMELFDRERTHIEAAFEFLAGPLTRPAGTLSPSEGERDGVRGTAATLLISLVDAMAYTGQLRFHPRQRIRWLEAQRDTAHLIKHRQAEGAALGNLGTTHAALGDARKAIEFFEQCLKLHREIGDRGGEGIDLGNLGNAHAALGDARKAIQFHEQALLIIREIGDRREEGNALGSLGIAHYSLGDARRAIEFYEQALVIGRTIGDRRGESGDLGNLGLAHAALGDARKAIEFYKQQLVIVREIGDRRGEGSALGNLGIAYFTLGEARKAIEFHAQALVIAGETSDRRMEGNALGNLGNAYGALGDARKAIGFYEQQLIIVREIGDRRGEGNGLWNSADELWKLGDRAQAIARAEAALRIFEAIEDPNAAKVRAALAGWRGQQGK